MCRAIKAPNGGMGMVAMVLVLVGATATPLGQAANMGISDLCTDLYIQVAFWEPTRLLVAGRRASRPGERRTEAADELGGPRL